MFCNCCRNTIINPILSIKVIFKINGNKYVLLIGTTGGVKSNSVLFVCEKWFDELWEDIKCGADFSTPIIPSKLMAYMALTFSQSTPVTNPKKIYYL